MATKPKERKLVVTVDGRSIRIHGGISPLSRGVGHPTLTSGKEPEAVLGRLDSANLAAVVSKVRAETERIRKDRLNRRKR